MWFLSVEAISSAKSHYYYVNFSSWYYSHGQLFLLSDRCSFKHSNPSKWSIVLIMGCSDHVNHHDDQECPPSAFAKRWCLSLSQFSKTNSFPSVLIASNPRIPKGSISLVSQCPNRGYKAGNSRECFLIECPGMLGAAFFSDMMSWWRLSFTLEPITMVCLCKLHNTDNMIIYGAILMYHQCYADTLLLSRSSWCYIPIYKNTINTTPVVLSILFTDTIQLWTW